ncbi:Sperm-associated antigen 6 [Symbiodinium microadriaticum]|uniref:Sperm-associated antigen 6 n=1 Tax=Symbiodinium microadriaticum TaxID=2951 RepID=A0A1Q9D4I2_SYMMI|nr:Sperm-associated antigen 6 [Symbiodinium microadriaticum]CAE7679847.1 SPAG6 [Symbiodinium sp. KB8]CAE7725006.1 SPAG6 [Symbiodinium microadriaticum]
MWRRRLSKEIANGEYLPLECAVPLLVLCFQEPELTLKRISASALSDICKHSPELAQTVVDAGAVSLLAKDISHNDAPLKRQVCSCLAQIAKHSVDLAEVVVEAEIFPRILHCLKDIDEFVRKNAATCIREIARHTPDLAKLIVNAGGVAAMVDYITEARGNNRLPGIMTLGYIAAFSETLALAVVVSKGIPPLKDALINEPEDHLKAASAWSLGQIGRHSPDHARALAEADVLRRLLAVYLHQDSSEDLRTKAKRALKSVIQKCTHLPALEPLLEAPPNILKYVVQQFAKVLPSDLNARKSFVQSGGLQKIQEVKAEVGSKLHDYIEEINMLYPPEIVQPGAKVLLAQLRRDATQEDGGLQPIWVIRFSPCRGGSCRREILSCTLRNVMACLLQFKTRTAHLASLKARGVEPFAVPHMFPALGTNSSSDCFIAY